MFRKFISATAVIAIIGVFFYFGAQKAGVNLDFTQLYPYKDRILKGFSMTIQISIYSMLLSLFLGSVLVVLKRSPFLVFQQFARAYVEIIRGTPLLVQIIFFFYIIGTAFNITNRLMAGVIILSIFESAYIGEILRGGLNSIESKQNEIAKSLGLNRWQTLRLIIIPQLFIRVLPALAGQFASVIKDSSLLSMIALIELTQVTKEITANNFNSYFVSYITLALLYLTLTFPISLLANTLEKRSQYEN